MQRRMSSRRQAPRALVEQSIGVLEERAQAAPLSVPALCALIHPPEDVAEVACDVGEDVVADNVARSANAPKSAPVTMMRARTGWCNYPMMMLGQVWQMVQAKAASRDGLWAWQIAFANGHLRKTKERRKVDMRINKTHRG